MQLKFHQLETTIQKNKIMQKPGYCVFDTVSVVVKFRYRHYSARECSILVQTTRRWSACMKQNNRSHVRNHIIYYISCFYTGYSQ